MTEKISTASRVFTQAARRVQQRLVIRKAMQMMLRTGFWAAGVLAVLSVLRLSGSSTASVALVMALSALWIAGCFVCALYRKPDAFSALAFWDKAAARSDAFANAWWFGQQTQQTRGQQWHIEQQQEKLSAALTKLKAEVCLPDVRRLVALPLCALIMLMLPTGHDTGLSDPKLSDEGKVLAKREGKKLADARLNADKMKALDEPEKREWEKLQQKIQDTAKALAQQPKTTREVLGQLEKSARDAERLAEKLAAGDAAWASEQMIAEMRKHADTADLGDAAANKSAENTGIRAQQLADKLKDGKLKKETSERFTEALCDIGKQAQTEDKERTVGQHVIAADKDLSQALAQEAGKEFQRLADKMRVLASREKAREQLEKLAQQLRESGSNIAGQDSSGMQQLAGNASQQNQQQMTVMPNAPQMTPMPPPDSFNGTQSNQQGQGNGDQQQLLTMTPAQGNSQQTKPGQQGEPSKDGKGDKPTLFAPIPNQNPNQPPDAVILGMTPGSSNGQQPGQGTAKMENKPTETIKANQSATVNAQRNADGSSTVRSVEGQAHSEQAARSAQSTALDAISAEENALNDAALPPARREQVRRYFTELRKRFEKQD